MTWTRRRTVIGGETQDDDWVVCRGGVGLGRVHRSIPTPGVQPFQWASWTHPPESGYSNTLDGALDACRAAIGDKPVPPEFLMQR